VDEESASMAMGALLAVFLTRKSSTQEVILSALYIYETVRILRTSLHDNTRKFMYQLFGINVIIIIMDVALLGVEFANLYIIQTTFKGVVYSIKLKLEFAVLGKLVQFVTAAPASIDSEKQRYESSANRNRSPDLHRRYTKEEEIPDFVDATRIHSDVTHASPTGNGRKSSRHFISDSELSLAMFEHVESAKFRPESSRSEADRKQQTGTVDSRNSGVGGDVLRDYNRASADVAADTRV
jgi:hypothetical protein